MFSVLTKAALIQDPNTKQGLRNMTKYNQALQPVSSALPSRLPAASVSSELLSECFPQALDRHVSHLDVFIIFYGLIE